MVTKKVEHFKIYPGSKRGFYFAVRVYPDEKSMRRACHRYGHPQNKHTDFYDNAAAATLCFRTGTEKENGRKFWRKGLGIIVFHRGEINGEVIAHECGHATIEWAYWKRLDFNPQNGELISGGIHTKAGALRRRKIFAIR